MLVACSWTPARDPAPSGPWDQYIIAYIKWRKCQCYSTYDGKVESKSEPANVDGIDNMTCIQCIVDWKNVIFIYIYIHTYISIKIVIKYFMSLKLPCFFLSF